MGGLLRGSGGSRIRSRFVWGFEEAWWGGREPESRVSETTETRLVRQQNFFPKHTKSYPEPEKQPETAPYTTPPSPNIGLTRRAAKL